MYKISAAMDFCASQYLKVVRQNSDRFSHNYVLKFLHTEYIKYLHNLTLHRYNYNGLFTCNCCDISHKFDLEEFCSFKRSIIILN